ncbi:MAG: hypothetical protein JST19_18115 [Bacteroidetes bacterium]|nr:hypothetical protein [Bacteroidota bacterium]
MDRKILYAVFIGIIWFIMSCKKENQYPIVGKWQQVKLHTYTQSYSGVISGDTTYQASSFNSGNYAQFNNDGTCIVGIFYPPGTYYTINSAAYISTAKYNYTPAGPKYVMTQPTTLIYPSGFITTDTASLDGNTVLIHAVFNSHANLQVSDSYYTK